MLIKQLGVAVSLAVAVFGGALLLNKNGLALTGLGSQLADLSSLASNQVGYWNFDDGTAIGKVGNAKDFINTSFNTGSDSIGSGAATVCAWINPRTLGTGNYTPNVVSNGVFSVYLFGKSPYNIGATSNAGSKYPSASGIPANTWSHVCVARTSTGSASFYVNGFLKSTADSGKPSKGYNNLIIGNRIQGGQDFDGLIDEVRVYNKTLSSSEVSAVYAYRGDTTPPPSGDTTPPAMPTNPQATTISSTQINLLWDAITDEDFGIADYKIYRNGVQIGTSRNIAYTSFPNGRNSPPLITYIYSDTGLTPSTAYSYTVAAFDPAGNTSTQTLPVSATTNPVTPPPIDTTAPSALSSVVYAIVSTSQINLAWSSSTDPTVTGAVTSGVAGYKIFRNGTQVGTSTTNSYSDTGLAAGTSYSYTVSVYDAAGNTSALSNPVTATTKRATFTVTKTVAGSGSGTITCNPVSCSNTVGSPVTLTASSATGSFFAEWSGACSGADSCSLTSAGSVVGTFEIGDMIPPPMPTSFGANADSSTQITLSWNDTVLGDGFGAFTTYRIYRNGVQVGIWPAGVVAYISYPTGPRGAPVYAYVYHDTGLTPGTNYTYTIAAYDSSKNTLGQTPPVSATTPSN